MAEVEKELVRGRYERPETHAFEFSSFFCSRTREFTCAEGLAQEVMLTVYTKAHQVRDRRLFRGWLFKIAHNALAAYYGKLKRNLNSAYGQESMSPPQLLQPGESTSTTTAGNIAPEGESKRIFFIIPNYRTAPTIEDFRTLTPEEKFAIGTDDAFDRGTIRLAALFGAESQVTNSNRSFGQGAAGFGKYFGASFADFAIGNYMTEAVYPALLHQDPRFP